MVDTVLWTLVVTTTLLAATVAEDGASFCVNKDSGRRYRLGERWTTNDGSCIQLTCLADGAVSECTCANVMAPPGCEIERPSENNKAYPECCPRVSCPAGRTRYSIFSVGHKDSSESETGKFKPATNHSSTGSWQTSGNPASGGSWSATNDSDETAKQQKQGDEPHRLGHQGGYGDDAISYNSNRNPVSAPSAGSNQSRQPWSQGQNHANLGWNMGDHLEPRRGYRQEGGQYGHGQSQDDKKWKPATHQGQYEGGQEPDKDIEGSQKNGKFNQNQGKSGSNENGQGVNKDSDQGLNQAGPYHGPSQSDYSHPQWSHPNNEGPWSLHKPISQHSQHQPHRPEWNSDASTTAGASDSAPQEAPQASQTGGKLPLFPSLFPQHQGQSNEGPWNINKPASQSSYDSSSPSDWQLDGPWTPVGASTTHKSSQSSGELPSLPSLLPFPMNPEGLSSMIQQIIPNFDLHSLTNPLEIFQKLIPNFNPNKSLLPTEFLSKLFPQLGGGALTGFLDKMKTIPGFDPSKPLNATDFLGLLGLGKGDQISPLDFFLHLLTHAGGHIQSSISHGNGGLSLDSSNDSKDRQHESGANEGQLSGQSNEQLWSLNKPASQNSQQQSSPSDWQLDGTSSPVGGSTTHQSSQSSGKLPSLPTLLPFPVNPEGLSSMIQQIIPNFDPRSLTNPLEIFQKLIPNFNPNKSLLPTEFLSKLFPQLGGGALTGFLDKMKTIPGFDPSKPLNPTDFLGLLGLGKGDQISPLDFFLHLLTPAGGHSQSSISHGNGGLSRDSSNDSKDRQHESGANHGQLSGQSNEQLWSLNKPASQNSQHQSSSSDWQPDGTSSPVGASTTHTSSQSSGELPSLPSLLPFPMNPEGLSSMIQQIIPNFDLHSLTNPLEIFQKLIPNFNPNKSLLPTEFLSKLFPQLGGGALTGFLDKMKTIPGFDPSKPLNPMDFLGLLGLGKGDQVSPLNFFQLLLTPAGGDFQSSVSHGNGGGKLSSFPPLFPHNQGQLSGQSNEESWNLNKPASQNTQYHSNWQTGGLSSPAGGSSHFGGKLPPYPALYPSNHGQLSGQSNEESWGLNKPASQNSQYHSSSSEWHAGGGAQKGQQSDFLQIFGKLLPGLNPHQPITPLSFLRHIIPGFNSHQHGDVLKAVSTFLPGMDLHKSFSPLDIFSKFVPDPKKLTSHTNIFRSLLPHLSPINKNEASNPLQAFVSQLQQGSLGSGSEFSGGAESSGFKTSQSYGGYGSDGGLPPSVNHRSFSYNYRSTPLGFDLPVSA